MTLNQFYENLSKMPRRLRRIARKYIKSPDGVSHCPITALCEHLTKKKYDITEVDSAAYQLNISYIDEKKITRAADLGFPEEVKEKMLSVLSE